MGADTESPSAEPLWALMQGTPWPAVLLDAGLRVSRANDAMAAFCGLARDAIAGRAWADFAPPEDREAEHADAAVWSAAARAGRPATLSNRRLIDIRSHVRWYRASVSALPDDREGRLLLVLQDVGAEQSARVQAERALSELAHWFDLSPSGMVMYDATGLVVRSNAAFERLVGVIPVSLNDAPTDLQALLGWHAGRMRPELAAARAPLESQVVIDAAQGRRRLVARLALVSGEEGRPRCMAVVEDRSAEEDRDLARLERDALMDAAGIGVATFDGARGWLPSAGPARGDLTTRAAVLQGVARDMVEPASRAEYERLQRALRRGERAEVRYAVRHPELGSRWLLTRVEPAALAGGRRAASVVTLDVTDRERAERRNEQLLRELGTILEGSTAGIAYLRGQVLVRCNRGFERMLGLEAGAAAGATLDEIFKASPRSQAALAEALAAMADGRAFEGEVGFERAGHALRWFALSMRRAEPPGGDPSAGEPEAVAVIADITRLKSQQAQLETLLRERELMFSLSEVGIAYQRGARIERANQALGRMTGYSVPELCALDAAELHPDARSCVEFEAQLQRGLRADGRHVGERRLRRRDGSLLWVQVGARLVDAEQPEAGFICSYVDVDERHRARDALQRQAERTRAVLDSVFVGIVTVAEGGIEWMNRSARRMFAGELADFVGEPVGLVATPEADHPLRRADWVQRLADGRPQTFECRLRGRDGREFWVAGNVVATARDGEGPLLTFALLDIERRRQAELGVAQARASLQRVIDTAPLAIALIEARTHRPLQANQTAEAFLAPPPDGLAQVLVDAAGGSDEVRREFVRGSGPTARVWDLRAVALPATGDGAVQVLLVASDVTEQRAADQARLQAAIAQREVLVKEVHHRIKNNLQGVAGLLQQHAQRHPEVAVTLGEAVAQVQAIAQVYGLQVGERGPLRALRVVEAIAQSVQRTFGRAIDVEAPDDGSLDHVLPEAEAIPLALTINELMTNAVKHGTGGSVRCRLHGDDGALVLELLHEGRLPAGFDLARRPGGISGLGLVRSLLPRRSATLEIAQQGAEVLTRVSLRSPSVQRPTPAPIGENDRPMDVAG